MTPTTPTPERETPAMKEQQRLFRERMDAEHAKMGWYHGRLRTPALNRSQNNAG